MNKYDFNLLNWEEFEEFSKDLLSQEMSIPFQSFSDGADGGIDLRYSSSGTDRTIIVQCKRYRNASDLMTALKKERPKLDAMKPMPKRYILVVSINLSENKINDLVKLFSPYIRSSTDIITPKQLNSVLAKHPEVEQRHYKLWLGSSNVLKAILTSRVSNYNGLIREKIQRTLQVYSPTPSFGEAMETLKDHGFIVIAGEPGVGKTTLAEIMSYYLLGNGDFDELIALPQSISDALEMMSSDPDKKQLFLFDDFLGSNYLENKLGRGEDAVLRLLIDNAQRLRRNKALIMTTREYILSQAQQGTDLLRDKFFLDAKYIVDLSNYDLVTKAKILYNHLAMSSMPQKHLQYFVDKKVYRDIIRHGNYSPRLIESINREKLWSGRSPEEFCGKLIESFNNPWAVYQDIFANKIDAKARNIMLVMMSIGRKIQLSSLHRAVVAYDKEIDETQLRKSVDILDGTFLSTKKDDTDQIIVDVLNPTIYDFLTNYYRYDYHSLQRLINSAVYVNQLIHTFITDEDSTAYKIQKSLSIYTPIKLDKYGSDALKTRLIGSWMTLPWIGFNARPDDIGVFKRIHKITAFTSDETLEATFRRAAINSLESAGLEIDDISSALFAFEYYCDPEELPEALVDIFIDELVNSVLSYEDMETIASAGWVDGVLGEIADRIESRLTGDSEKLDIIDEEVRSRLADGESVGDLEGSMAEVLEYYGLDLNFIYSIFDEVSDPPEDYDGSNFYTSDDDYKDLQEGRGDNNREIDSIFRSLTRSYEN